MRKDFSDISVTVTPDLVSQVSTAALTNPALKSLLHLAAAGKATEEQQKTLGQLIRSLRAVQQPGPVPGHPSTTGITGTLGVAEAPRPIDSVLQVREFDIVIEFQEKPSDRWILPRGPAVCERRDAHSLSDVLLSTVIQSASSQPTESSEKTATATALHVVSINISRVPQALWELLLRWSGGEEGIAKSREALREIAGKAPPRAYLQYQLPDGPLLEQLKNAVPPHYNTKPVMPSNADSTRSRRKASRKQRDLTQSRTLPAQPTSQSTSHSKHKSRPRVAEPPIPIACWSCGRPDVPLLNFGRYCKGCISAGRASDTAAHLNQPQAHRDAVTTTVSNHQPWTYAGSRSYDVSAGGTTTSSPQTPSRDATRLTTTTEIVPVIVRPQSPAPQMMDHDMGNHS